MDNYKIQECQKYSLELLKAFVDICNKYDLKYYMGGGTMLGAIRHKGFIPWDDDVDIDMPRKDFQKFLEISDKAMENYPYYKVFNFYKDNDFSINISFADTRKKRLLSDRLVPRYDYVSIDVVPVDGIPDNIILRKINNFKLNMFRCMYKLSILKMGGVISNYKKKEKREWYKKFLVYIGTKFPIDKLINYKFWARKYDKALMKYSYSSCKLIGTLQSYHGKKSIFPAEWYGKGTKYQFEGMEVIGVDNYDAWLTQLYGDYMKLPDEANRIGHDLEIIDED